MLLLAVEGLHCCSQPHQQSVRRAVWTLGMRTHRWALSPWHPEVLWGTEVNDMCQVTTERQLQGDERILPHLIERQHLIVAASSGRQIWVCPLTAT